MRAALDRPVAVGRGRRGRLHPAAPQLRRRAGPARRSTTVLARLKPWLENAARGQGRPEHQVRQPCVRQRTASRCAATRTTRMLQSYVLEAHKPHSLESLAVPPPRPHGPDLRGGLRQGREPDPVRAGRRSTRAAEYSCEDSDMALHVHQALWPQIEAEPRPARRLPSASRCRPSAVLGAHRAHRRADRRGAARGAEPASSPSACWRSSSEAYELAGQPFNLGSPKQIGEILFGKLGLPVQAARPRAARRRTDEEVLAEARRRLSRCRPRCSSTAACRS